MRATPAFAAALLTVSLALAGCGGAGDSGARSESAAKPAAQKQQGAGAGDVAAPREGGGQQQVRTPAQRGTQVIRTAALTVRVKDAQKALTTARRAAESAGGLVENESTERDPAGRVTSRIVLRVPQDAYGSVLDELAGTGTLVARKADAKDVTDQVVDVNSRVASQRVSVARVRELMDRATKLSDVVALEGELSSRQAALESLLAQQASLRDRTTLATITLDVSETPVAKKERKREEDPGFLDALGGGWDAFTATLRWIAVVIGAVAPFAAALAVLYLLWRLVRGLPARRPVGAHQGPARVPAWPTGPAPDGPDAAPDEKETREES
ncbi:DUF4349 domain-containing protein [Streptomyces sp. AK02-01A]|uniref:DUF4349 domain-containing protein n=1 Tax=Streptomyces sp. AK02-01A TaxID=3028648 RepID=UPI0029BCB071|nr:DUF4349 domain-containing protein [Streptomyces sp. AK02-01A]MDX3850691.1 DUF4349 domain-containing protein [Streptomyces sp. AK02-01A]